MHTEYAELEVFHFRTLKKVPEGTFKNLAACSMSADTSGPQHADKNGALKFSKDLYAFPTFDRLVISVEYKRLSCNSKILAVGF